MDGGEKEDRGDTMPRRKHGRSLLSRGIEAVVGVFVAYISSYATEQVLQVVLLVVGITIVLHSVLSS